MTADITTRADELRRQSVPFVHARVVLAEAPTSAKPGAEAIVLADGTIEGFVGGDCAESTVRAQGLALLDRAESLLLRITPEPEPDQSGKLVVHNPCLSGGTLEIFLEPVLPAPLLAIVGDAPIASALAGVAERIGWRVTSDVTSLGETSAVVVASHGKDEVEALRWALDAEVPYVGLVASIKRGNAVVGLIEHADASRIHTPAGLDIGARTPDEVALSIMAEIVSLRPRPSGREIVDRSPAAGTATDPICGMDVAMVDSSLHLDRDGERHWFCGPGCLRAFSARAARAD